MKVEIHTLANSSVDSLVLNYHSKVFNYFGYSPIYSKENIYEGGKNKFLDHIKKIKTKGLCKPGVK